MANLKGCPRLCSLGIKDTNLGYQSNETLEIYNVNFDVINACLDCPLDECLTKLKDDALLAKNKT